MTKRAAAAPAAPIGRPTIQTDDLVNTILARIADGGSVRKVLAANDLPARSTWHEWLLADVDLQARYALAKEIGAENQFDETLDAVEGCKANKNSIAKARLEFDAKRWRLGCMYPKKYNTSRVEQVLTDSSGGNPFAALMEAVAANGRPCPGS